MALSLVPWQLWAVAGFVAALAIGGWYIDRQAFKRGFSASDAQWGALVEREIGRRREVNDAAQDWARSEMARLQEGKDERDALIERLDAAAEADANAGNVCLGVDSVRRLNIGN